MGTQSRTPSDRVAQLAFDVTDPTVPCVAASERFGCRFQLEEFIPRDGGRYAEFYSIDGVDPDDLMELVSAHEDSEGQFITREDDGGLLELVVDDTCPALELAELGALPRRVDCTDGCLEIEAEVPAQYNAAEIASQFLEAYPSADLQRQRHKDQFAPLFSRRELDRAIESRLTDRQAEVLTTAHRNGYYEWPREATAEELAAELDISPATFSEHLRAAERVLVTMLFETVPSGSGRETVVNG